MSDWRGKPQSALLSANSSPSFDGGRGSSLTIWVLMVLMTVMIGRVHEVFLWTFRLGRIAGIILVILFLLEIGRKGRTLLVGTPQVKCAAILLGFAILSIPGSLWRGFSVGVLLSVYLKILLFFYVIACVCVRVRDVERLIWGLALSVWALGVVVIWSHLTGRLAEGVNIAVSGRFGERLAVGTTYDSNDMAFVLVCAVPFLVCYMEQAKGWRKPLLVGTILISLGALTLTLSRGGFLGIMAVAGYLVLTARRGIVGPRVVIAFLALAVFIFFAPPQYWERITTMLHPSSTDAGAGTERLEIWKNAFRNIVLVHPVFGVGIGAFTVAEGLTHGGAGKWSAAHNSFLEIWAEQGTGALICFVAMIWVTIRQMRRIRHIGREDRRLAAFEWISRAVEGSLIGYCTAGFFLSQEYSSMLYFTVAVGSATYSMSQRVGASVTPVVPVPPPMLGLWHASKGERRYGPE